MADFDGRIDAQRLAAIRTGFARSDATQIGVGRGLEVFARRDVLNVIVLFVGAGDQVVAAFEGLDRPAESRLVNVASSPCPVDSQRPQESGRRMEELLDFVFLHGTGFFAAPAQ